MRGRRDTFGTFIDVRRSLAMNQGPMDAAAFCVTGVALSAPRLDLRGRRGTFSPSIDVRGSLATNWGHMDAAAFCVTGVTLAAPQARFA